MKYIVHDRFTRRQFIKGVGGALVALPFLPSIFAPRNAEAQSAIPPRIITVYIGHGAITEPYLYGNYENSIAWTTQQLLPGHVIRHGNLPNGPLSPLFENLYPLRNKMSVVRGLDTLQYMAHNRALGTGLNFIEAPASHNSVRVQPSIDQFLAWSPTFFNQRPTPHRSLVVGGWSAALMRNGPGDRDYEYLPARHLAHEAYDQVFGTPSSGPAADSTAVDRVFPAYQQLRNSNKLSAVDKQRLDSHLQGLQELQQRLQLAVNCQSVTRPPYVGISPEPQARQNSHNLNDVIVAALRCGQTRVANLFLTENSAPAFSYDLHGTIHAFVDPASHQIWFNQVKWQIDNVLLHLLQRLDAVIEENGRTMLDNSLVLLHWENFVPHENFDCNMILFGGLGGKFQMGKFYDYRNRSVPFRWGFNHTSPGFPGIPQNTMFNSILQSMGISPAEYEQPRSGAYLYGGYSPFFADNNWGDSSRNILGRTSLRDTYYIPSGVINLNSATLPAGLYIA